MVIYKKQEFEAIAVCDYKKEENKQAAVVVDPEYSIVALCVYDQMGNVELSETWNENSNVSVSSAMMGVNSDLANWRNSIPVIRNALTEFYMTNQMMDSSFLLNDTSLSASELMSIYKQCGGNDLDNALKSAKDKLAEKAIALTNIRILFVGNMSEFFPGECLARVCFSPLMPMLPDDRFTVIGDTKSAISRGVDLIEKSKCKKIDGRLDWILCGFDSENKVVQRSITLVEDQTPVDAFIHGVFNDELVFAIPNDQITFEFNGVRQNVVIPKGFISEEGAMIQLGLQFEGNGFSLLLKNNESIMMLPLSVNVRGE